MISTNRNRIALIVALTLAAATANANKLYQDDRVELTFPDSWSLQPVYETVTGDTKGERKIGIVLIDGPFQLYVLTHYGQTSGIIGGRFSEISRFIVPWLKSSEPAACISSFEKKTSRITNKLSRTDLLLTHTKTISNDPACDQLHSPSETQVWAGAFFRLTGKPGQAPGFFLDLPVGSTASLPDHQMVLAESARASGPDALPSESDVALASFLESADNVIRGIQFR